MDYNEFRRIIKTGLPLNRKERFYTGTVLPALLFHNGLSNFYAFLRSIKRFPPEINEANTGDSFLFYTEYNLKESAGKRNVGVRINALTNETPDVIIEILKPKKAFIIIEAKMFAKASQDELTQQIKKQKDVIGNVLTKELGGEECFHLALVPQKLEIRDTAEYQVVNWDFFLDNENLNAKDNRFYNYLRFAIENYDDLVSLSAGPASTVEFYMKGLDLYEFDGESSELWVGRKGGETVIQEDKRSGKWQKHKYCVNSEKPSNGQAGNWIPLSKFKDIIDAP